MTGKYKFRSMRSQGLAPTTRPQLKATALKFCFKTKQTRSRNLSKDQEGSISRALSFFALRHAAPRSASPCPARLALPRLAPHCAASAPPRVSAHARWPLSLLSRAKCALGDLGGEEARCRPFYRLIGFYNLTSVGRSIWAGRSTATSESKNARLRQARPRSVKKN